MKMTKRSRKLLLSAGMLAAVVTIPSPPLAEAVCSVRYVCANGTILLCRGITCEGDPNGQYLRCNGSIFYCN